MLSFEALEELTWHQQCSDEDRIGVWHGSDARGRTSFSGRGGSVTIGLKRHYPARGRVSAGWRPGSGFNNAVPSMVGSLEVVRSGLGWDPLMGRRLGPSADEQRASVCARARARCQWRQLANYTGRLHPIADVGHP